MSFGVECPSYGVYARVTKVKNWIQFIAEGAVDSNCNQEVPYQPGGYVSIQRCPSGLQSFNSADAVADIAYLIAFYYLIILKYYLQRC